MKKTLLNIFNLKKITFLLLAFIGLSSFQVNAQDIVTFLQTPTDGEWQTLANWDTEALPGTTEQALILYAGDLTLDQSRTIGNLKFQTNTSRSVLDGGSSSSAILTLDTPSATSRLIDNTSSKAITIYPSINFTASGVIYNRNKTGNQLIFTGGTIYINSNTITTDSRSTHATNQYITFDGPVVGDGIINVDDSQAAGATQGISLGADADFSTFTGTINALNNPIVSSTTNAFGSALTLDGTASFEINVASTFTGSISRLATTAGAATVTFNANQSMGALTVDTQNLAIDFAAAATTVEFSEYTTSTSEGVVDLQNYVSGSLKIGSTGTSVDSAILDTWTLDGATAAITQDTDGSIIFAGCSTPDDITTLAATAGAEYVSLSWDDPTCFDEVLVVAKEASAVTVTPTGDGSAYTADADFDSGTDLGTSEYAVFKGVSNTVDVTGLTKGGTTYHFTVFTRKGTTWNTGVTISATTNNMYTSTSGANGTGLNWEDASSWIAGVIPSATSDDVTINTGIVINSDVDVNNIVIDARVTVKEGFSLTANDLQQNSQLIVGSISDAFASVIATTLSGTGTLIYNRWLNDSPNNDLISSPVSGVPFSSVAEASTNESRFFINPDDATNYFFGPFNNVSGEFETYSTGTDDAVVIGTGQGYRAATIAGAANTVRFVGNIEVGNVDIDITDGGDATYGQWNLIGNPYSSYLDFDTFWTANSTKFEAGLNNAIYAWNGDATNTYTALNTLSGAKIAPGQGFFVKTIASTTGTVTFTPAMRVTGNSDDFVAGKSANTVNKALAKINLSSATKTFATDIYFVENQTRGLDNGYDAGAFAGSTDGIFTNLVEDNIGEGLLIQALPYEDFNDVVVPVSINAEANTELTISLDDASLTLPANTYVYLKDNLLNTTTLLNDTDYVFTPDTELSGSGRFFIQFSAKSVLSTDEFALNELLIYTNQASKSIIIKGILQAAASAKVYDIQGRMVLEQKLDSSSVTNVVNANALKTGIYMVQLEDKVQKVIIK